MKRIKLHLAVLLLLISSSGTTCMKRGLFRDSGPQAPVLLQPSASLSDVLQVVNANSKIRELEAQGARISVPGSPRLRASLVLKQPGMLRLRAGLFDFSGPEIDLGSNEELFWFWVKQHPDPAVYYARHEEFSDSEARRLMPIDFDWFLDAVGLIALDPALEHEGPLPAGEGKLEIRTRLPGPDGVRTRVTVVDNKYGFVLEQHLRDAEGRLLVSIQASEHRYYPPHLVSLPHHLEIHLLPGHANQLKLTLDVAGYQVNRITGSPAQLFKMPTIEGYPQRDITTLPGVNAQSSARRQGTVERVGYRSDSSGGRQLPRFRGDTLWR